MFSIKVYVLNQAGGAHGLANNFNWLFVKLIAWMM